MAANNTDQFEVRFRTKPVERRTLNAPGISTSQGIFECWLDIMTQAQATAFPPDDVALPPRQLFELRVVIWKTKNVPPMDWLEGECETSTRASTLTLSSDRHERLVCQVLAGGRGPARDGHSLALQERQSVLQLAHALRHRAR